MIIVVLEKPPIAPHNETRNYGNQLAATVSSPTRNKLRTEDNTRRSIYQQTERSTANTNVNTTDKLGLLISHWKFRVLI